jgi:hypothetical protein
MATTSNFYQYVLPDVSGCPEISADIAIRAAVIEFCEKSLVLQRDHDPLQVVAGIIDYDLEPATDNLVTKIMRVWFKDVELIPIAPDNVARAEIYNSAFTGANVSQSDPRFYLQKDARTLTIYPIPKATVSNALTIRVAYKPTRTAKVIDDFLFEDYAETIAHGAKFRLLSMASKPWTNGPAAAAAMALFNSGVNVARQRASRGNSRADVRVTLTGV